MKYFLMLLLLGGCSYFKSTGELSHSSKDVPAWVYSPYDTCSETQELCATGEAKTYADADAEARNNLASIFEIKVQSDFTSHSSTQGQSLSAPVREEVQRSLKESVNQVLETVQIRKRFKKRGLSYSLASLDRAKASELIGSRLTKLDYELDVLWNKRNRTNLRNIEKLFLEREKLNERFSIVSGSPRPALMTFQDIVAWKESRPVGEPLILKIGQAPDWMVENLKELLTESGFKLVKSEASKIISLNVESIKEFLNVEGFEKYTFTMNMTSFDQGEKKKVISFSETVTGRTQSDALLKVKDLFNNYIEEHLSDLHLD